MSRKDSVRLCCFVVLMVGLSLLATAGAVSPLGPDADTVIVASGNPIEIAVATCGSFPADQDIYDAVQLAMDDYGPIQGFSVQHNDFDTLCDQASGAAAAATIVANAQHVGVVGPIHSSSTRGAAPVFEAEGLIMISPTSSAVDLPLIAPHIFNRAIIPDPEADAWLAVLPTLPSVVSWQAYFEATYGRQPDSLAVLAYDAASLLLTRIDEVSQISGSDLVVERAALAAAVRNTAGWPGASGPVSLEVDGDRVNEQTTAVWADDFSTSELDLEWSWIAEDATHWSLTEAPGFMRIVTQAGNSNRLVRKAPWVDFEIRTRVLFDPQENFQIAGLYVYGDEANHLKLGRAYCDPAIAVCVGNGIYFDHVEGGVAIGDNCAMTTDIQDEAYLRIVQEGADVGGYVSTDGTTWTSVCTHTIGFQPGQVGLKASNQSDTAAEIPADFDYFVLQSPALHPIQLPLIRRFASGPALTVGLVTDVNGINDLSFNQTTWAGLQRAEEELGIEAAYRESPSEADYEPNITAFIQEGSDLIFTVSFLMTEATSSTAAAYPEATLAIMDVAYDPPIPNVAGVVFQVDEATFAAGYLAAGWAVLQDAADPQIGYVAGMDIPPVQQFVVAYEAGADYYNLRKGTSVQVKGVYVGDFNAFDQGKIQANSLIDEGVDVIFGVGGETAHGALVATKERGKWGIGVDVDQYYSLADVSDILLTSVLKRLDNAAYAVVRLTQLGTFPGGDVYVGTLANRGVGLAPYHDFQSQIPARLDLEVQAVMAGIIAGTIDTGW